MIKLNDDSIYVGEIKQILKNFNLPTIKVYRSDDLFVEGDHYIKDGYICLYKNGEFEKEELYVYNRPYLNITKNLIIYNNIYDSYTHRHFGEYLRFQRDYNNVDLMSMYNCCDGVFANNINIKIGETKTFCDDEGYKVYCFPAKFNRKYTIGIDCSSKIEVVAGFYNNDKVIDALDDSFVSISDKIYKSSYNTYASVSMNRPVLYENLTSNISDSMYVYENILTLFVKVPISNTSSLVVLEGDYLSNFKIILSSQKFEDSMFAFRDYDRKRRFYCKEFVSKLELLSNLNASSQYLLATRMIEYVTKNAICPLSESYDVRKLQKKLVKKGLLDKDYYGVWREIDRLAVCQFITENNLVNTKYDMLSYLDKDAEQKMGDIE